MQKGKSLCFHLAFHFRHLTARRMHPDASKFVPRDGFDEFKKWLHDNNVAIDEFVDFKSVGTEMGNGVIAKKYIKVR